MNQNIKILCVEDTFENRILIRRILQAEGFTVLEADSASTALEVLETEIPDLILMDINMPDIDGYTLTARLRTVEKLKKIPIIALTANVLKGDRERTLAAGCNGYIQKPIDVDSLPDQIASYLER